MTLPLKVPKWFSLHVKLLSVERLQGSGKQESPTKIASLIKM